MVDILTFALDNWEILTLFGTLLIALIITLPFTKPRFRTVNWAILFFFVGIILIFLLDSPFNYIILIGCIGFVALFINGNLLYKIYATGEDPLFMNKEKSVWEEKKITEEAK